MVLGKAGQAALVGLGIGVMIFMMAMVFTTPLKEVITEYRNASNLDCDNSSITDGTKSTCLMIDLLLPYFIISVLAVAGGWVTARIIG